MSKVAIITDSTAYIPDSMLNGLSIHTVPLQVIFGEQVYEDGITIHPEEFYTRLQMNKVNPSTSQATPASFKKLYLHLLDEGFDILNIVISSKLSGTLDSAQQAMREFPGAPIEFVDSLSTSMALGFQVLTVAKAAAKGATLNECKALAEMALEKTGALFTVNTLEYLHRGGRIGGASAFLGTALDLKPILELREGKIEPIDRVRTLSKAIDQLVDLFVERADGCKNLQIACVHAKAPEEATNLLEKVTARFPKGKIITGMLSEVSPVIGTHTGPGTIGIAYMLGMN
jgi:DegV family protein with EDD domain